ncbi:MAG: tautomerase family protein [Bacillota bacterium]
MPYIEVTTFALPREAKRELARRITEAFAMQGVPADWVKVVFHRLEPEDYVQGGIFPYEGREVGKEVFGPGIADITVGPLEEAEKRRIAEGVSAALTGVGIEEERVQIRFRHVSGRDIAEGGGVFPFRPPGSTW